MSHYPKSVVQSVAPLHVVVISLMARGWGARARKLNPSSSSGFDNVARVAGVLNGKTVRRRFSFISPRDRTNRMHWMDHGRICWESDMIICKRRDNNQCVDHNLGTFIKEWMDFTLPPLQNIRFQYSSSVDELISWWSGDSMDNMQMIQYVYVKYLFHG